MESTGYYHQTDILQIIEYKVDNTIVKGWYPGVIVVAK